MSRAFDKRIVRILAESDLVPEEDLAKAQELAVKDKCSVTSVLVDMSNNIKALKLGAPQPVKTIHLRHNTFFLNWPFNPDDTSSNVSAGAPRDRSDC